MKKKILSVLVMLAMVFAFTACGSGGDSGASEEPATEPATYESILDEYTQKIEDATPGLIDEYNEETAELSGDIEALAELSNSKVEDIHLEERWIDLRGTKTAAARRIVPVHEKIIPLIKKRIVLNSTGYIFRNNRDNKIDYYGYLTSFFEPMCDAFNMRHTPHECRHSFATYAAASRMNPILVKKIIGHSAQDLTQDTYTHAMIEDLVAEIDKYTL